MTTKQKLPKGMYKRGGVYYCNVTFKGKRVRKRLSGNFERACKLLDIERGMLEMRGYGILDNEYPWKDLKNEYLEYCEQTQRRSSVDQMSRALRFFELFRPITSVRQLDAAFVFAYRNWRLQQKKGGIGGRKTNCGDKVSPASINNEVAKIGTMLNWAVDTGKLASNPMGKIKPLPHTDPRKVRRALTVEEVNRILEASPTPLRNILRMYLVTGMRHEEVTGLRFVDIDFAGRTVKVQASIAKNKRSREIPLDDETLEMIQGLKAAAADRRPDPMARKGTIFSQDHVFVRANNTVFDQGIVLRMFRAVCKRLGIEGCEPCGSVDIHSLRATVTSIMFERGATGKEIQEILGHKTASMTLLYDKPGEARRRKALATLPWVKSVSPPDGIVPIVESHKADTTDSPTCDKPVKLHVAG
jgi:integrase/recombinase XerD